MGEEDIRRQKLNVFNMKTRKFEKYGLETRVGGAGGGGL